MLRKGQEGHVRAERDILKSASLVSTPGGAEWIVRLHYSFQDRDHLYLVSHPCHNHMHSSASFLQPNMAMIHFDFISDRSLITWAEVTFSIS